MNLDVKETRRRNTQRRIKKDAKRRKYDCGFRIRSRKREIQKEKEKKEICRYKFPEYLRI